MKKPLLKLEARSTRNIFETLQPLSSISFKKKNSLSKIIYEAVEVGMYLHAELAHSHMHRNMSNLLRKIHI